MGGTSLSHGTVSASLATGVFRGNEAQKFHELSGSIKARQIAALSHGRYGHCKLDAAQGLQGFHHGVEAPGFDPLLEFLVETLETFGVFGNSADIFLKDDLLRRGRTAHLREPPEVGWSPMSLAGVAAIVA